MHFKLRFLSFFLVFLLILVFAYPNVQAFTRYHAEKRLNHEEIDISLNWDISLLKGEWREFCLWDKWPVTQCYIAFKYGLDVSFQVPAKLDVTYPNIVEPGDNFEVTTSLNLLGTRLLTINPEFLLKIHLMLPSPIYIPTVGFSRDFHNTFGSKWTLSFDINSQVLRKFIDKIFVGDANTLKSYINDNLFDFVSIQDISYNSNTLGELISGTIKIDLLNAILNTAEKLSITNPAIKAALAVLKWLVQDVFNTSSGLLITPRLSTRIEAPINIDNRVQNLGSSSLSYSSDLSNKVIPALLSPNSEEDSYGNHFSIDLSPLVYRLFFDVDWDYYIDVNLQALGTSLYKNNWNFDLFKYPKLSWDAVTVKQKIPFNMKLDEPLTVDEPQSEAGTVRINLYDKSGIEKAVLKYSKDQNTWQKIQMSSGSNAYSATPSVPRDTPIYYSIIATDGDGDDYEINNQGSYFNYIHYSPEPSNTPINDISGIKDFISKIPTPILVGIPITIAAIIFSGIIIKKRSCVRSRASQQKSNRPQT
ncbi:MAG: hypothetical protein OEY10_05655 [Nitrosopumilus sp.]|nr:hypothetical protein [Candidatus Bathyarchaeota archaeon]MDH5665764.1 hypothetical protein [Nitrosopumilus sp.]